MAIYKWRSDATPVSTGGVYWNETAGLISIGSTTSSWVTIADKNLGATTVWTSGATASESNCGTFYQWGNNYAFPYSGTVTPVETQIDASSYGPGNYYSSSTFVKTNPWYSTNNYDLWGGLTGTNAAMQGPCSSGFHIPSWSDITDLQTQILALGLTRTQLFEYLKWSYGGWRSQYTGNVSGTASFLWSSTLNTNSRANIVSPDYLIDSSSQTNTHDVSDGCSIRPFADTPVVPTTDWTVLYQPS